MNNCSKHVKPHLLAADLGCEHDTSELIAKTDVQQNYYNESIYDGEAGQKAHREGREV
ncbi:MAG: hypothetical protein ILA39_05150 [Bacteroidaceae bacterium]|nr:hypothetical protein [Bacteroidaceae bacterium]